jgi:hypothetical protein
VEDTVGGMSPLSRRSFLAAGAGAALLAACGDSKKAATTSSGSNRTSGSASAAGDLVIVSFSDTSALVPGAPQRIPFGFADKDGVVVDKPPAPLVDFEVTLNDQTVATLKAAPHQTDLPRPYYPIVFTPPQAGAYSVTATVNGARLQTAVQIPATTTVIGPGQKMVPVDTPTTADPKGQLVCTREPACPLHDITLRAALAGGTPVAFLVATPKFCQTAICGPVLDVLLKQKDQFPQIKMLHAEVYPSEAAAQPGVQKVTEAVNAYGLTFEPVLYLAKPDGTIAVRVDTIFDGVELHDALAQLVS